MVGKTDKTPETGPDLDDTGSLTGLYRAISENPDDTGLHSRLLRRASDHALLLPANENERELDLTGMSYDDIKQKVKDVFDRGVQEQDLVYALVIARNAQRENVVLKARQREILRNLFEFQKLAEDWKRIATTDQLTGMPNRYYFMTALEEMVSRRHEELLERGDVDKISQYAVVFIDIDKFKAINDTYGHKNGDLALQVLAERLTKLMREDEPFFRIDSDEAKAEAAETAASGEIAARLGGDEFVALISAPPGKTDFAEGATNRLNEGLKGLYITVDGQRIDINCSVGIEVVSDHSGAEAVLERADKKMYIEKRGKGVERAREELERRQPGPDDPARN